jgi:tetratricopeptide (TPR) repeat protein
MNPRFNALLAQALARQARNEADAATLAEGLDLANQAWAVASTPVEQKQAGLLQAHFHYRRGELLQLLNTGLVVLPLVAEHGPPQEHFDLLRIVVMAGCDTGAFDIALPLAHRAHRLALAELGADRQGLGLNCIACCFERMGDPWRAELLMGQALALLRTVDEPTPLFITINNLLAVQLGIFHLLRDAVHEHEAREPLQRGRALADEAQALAKRIGDPFMAVFAGGNAGELLTHAGHHAEARQVLEPCLALARRLSARMQIWRIECTLGELALLEGQTTQAWELLHAVLQASGGTDAPVTHLRLHYALWHTARARRRPSEALHHLEQYEKLSRQRSLRQLRAQSQLLVLREDLQAHH